MRRNGLSLWIAEDDVVERAGDGPRRQGATSTFALPNELRKLSPGFYMALGDAGFETEEPTPDRALLPASGAKPPRASCTC